MDSNKDSNTYEETLVVTIENVIFTLSSSDKRRTVNGEKTVLFIVEANKKKVIERSLEAV